MDKKNITMSEEVVELIHRHRKEQRQERMQASLNASKAQSYLQVQKRREPIRTTTPSPATGTFSG